MSELVAARHDDVMEALKNVIDPELGVNIVDLGLIYGIEWDDENDALVIRMTLTPKLVSGTYRLLWTYTI